MKAVIAGSATSTAQRAKGRAKKSTTACGGAQTPTQQLAQLLHLPCVALPCSGIASPQWAACMATSSSAMPVWAADAVAGIVAAITAATISAPARAALSLSMPAPDMNAAAVPCSGSAAINIHSR
ncbi:hypothetical protein SAMN02982985_03096 [Rugamonas rubra]|uniref:Uncharacterized protein n=1 Tax=Rugamonas rubra TaxID=758825 RepID=A0A1I4NTG6_9BURK|nr:hypothetical protein SAMN02982985_03096 [Rugamonas rubra]